MFPDFRLSEPTLNQQRVPNRRKSQSCWCVLQQLVISFPAGESSKDVFQKPFNLVRIGLSLSPFANKIFSLNCLTDRNSMQLYLASRCNWGKTVCLNLLNFSLTHRTNRRPMQPIQSYWPWGRPGCTCLQGAPPLHWLSAEQWREGTAQEPVPASKGCRPLARFWCSNGVRTAVGGAV